MADTSGCSAVLVSNILVASSHSDLEFAAMHIIDQRSYDELKRQFIGGATVPIPALGSIVQGSSDFSDFQQKRSSLFQQSGYTNRQELSLSIVRSYVPESHVAAWRDCMRRHFGTQIGLHVIEHNSDIDSVTVEFLWRSPPGVVAPLLVTSSTVSGAKPRDQQIAASGGALPAGFQFVVNGSFMALYDRIAGQDFDVVVNASGYSATLSIPRYTPPPPPPKTVIAPPNINEAVDGFSYRLVANHSGLRLDVYGSNQNEGGRVCQAFPNVSDAQIWQLTKHPVHAGCHILTARCSGKCLDVLSGSKTSGDPVCQAAYNATEAQAWIVDRHPIFPGCYLIRARHSGLCLDVYGGNTGNNADICQAAYNATAPQAWRFERLV